MNAVHEIRDKSVSKPIPFEFA
ncbi:hypothetical protein MPL3365_210038 [Mesorhizobium plurifarium]|uniref:Uncharacterized protein n=1 Tax=Mesorhizobium plurifarium TaxID=69974 RepID=A0A090GUA0_MESPL|nr:hypothetical protein MPL3365_210038 [Mesorhizobium plurifarium]